MHRQCFVKLLNSLSDSNSLRFTTTRTSVKMPNSLPSMKSAHFASLPLPFHFHRCHHPQTTSFRKTPNINRNLNNFPIHHSRPPNAFIPSIFYLLSLFPFFSPILYMHITSHPPSKSCATRQFSDCQQFPLLYKHTDFCSTAQFSSSQQITLFLQHFQLFISHPF